MILNRFDLLYGLKKETKLKFNYWLISVLASLFVVIGNKHVLSFNYSINSNWSYLIVDIFLCGIACYTFYLFFGISYEMKKFKGIKNRYYVRQRVLNNTQKKRLLQIFGIKKKLYNFVINPDNDTIRKVTNKEWNYFVKKLGGKKTVLTKEKFVRYLEMKIRKDLPLDDREISYVNEIMFSKLDIDLFKRLHKILEDKSR